MPCEYFLLIRHQRRPCLLAIDDGLSLAGQHTGRGFNPRRSLTDWKQLKKDKFQTLMFMWTTSVHCAGHTTIIYQQRSQPKTVVHDRRNHGMGNMTTGTRCSCTTCKPSFREFTFLCTTFFLDSRSQQSLNWSPRNLHLSLMWRQVLKPNF